jgi:hypothetical protein
MVVRLLKQMRQTFKFGATTTILKQPMRPAPVETKIIFQFLNKSTEDSLPELLRIFLFFFRTHTHPPRC